MEKLSERALWTNTRKHLAPYGRLLRIESGLTEQGIPDVIYCIRGHTGWLELKFVKTWPLRESTPLRVDHLTLEQVLFAETWSAAGGTVHTLIQVERSYFLLDAPMTRRLQERAVTRLQMASGAVAHGEGTFPTVPVVKALMGRSGAIPSFSI